MDTKVICKCMLLLFMVVKPNHAICGGERAPIKQAPYAAMYRPVAVEHWCGASVLTRWHVLTAASCYDQKYVYEVITGSDMAHFGYKHGIAHNIIHPSYDARSHDYDVMVVKLKMQLDLADYTQPIPIVSSANIESPLVALGFGMTQRGIVADKLMRVKLPLVDHIRCQSELKKIVITDRMLCAGGVTGNSTGKYDAGGPLVSNGTLVGVTSLSVDVCQTSRMPSVFTSVVAVKDFIDDIINPIYVAIQK